MKLLERIHTETRKVMEAKNKAAALELLEQCQSAAISLGEMIEELEGEGVVTIPLIEEYCEMVYEIYEEVRQNPAVNANRIHNCLARQMIRIRNSVCQDIRIRTEAVFLPYKASMWDSLESVWRAACEDPDCDAYVVPIPYYDRKADGSFGEMHYEGGLYGADVPVVDYKTYDFETRRPDMIFIHNPYDKCNFVTSVPPYFYSKNLKQFTDKLVYIPYFLMGEIDPDDKQTLEGISHFCVIPGVINADVVVVQSESMRKAYINVLTGYFGKSSKKRWERKILGLGSPKLDKVRETQKEEQELPEEWMRVIRKADGSMKKVILYNTSVTALLENEEKMLDKIRDTLGIFRENREEVALLWRPHPLIRATIESMRPRLWEEYRKIADRYREEGWGIYDDSADLNRAIAVCDGYYGDGSSVVELCKEAGKPVMIQNTEIIGDMAGG